MNMTNEDAISREDALMALTGEWTEKTDEIIHRFIRRIKALPSVTPKQRTGHWIYTGDYLTEGMLKCSECGEEIDVSKAYYDFCPVCSTRMESEGQS